MRMVGMGGSGSGRQTIHKSILKEILLPLNERFHHPNHDKPPQPSTPPNVRVIENLFVLRKMRNQSMGGEAEEREGKETIIRLIVDHLRQNNNNGMMANR